MSHCCSQVLGFIDLPLHPSAILMLASLVALVFSASALAGAIIHRDIPVRCNVSHVDIPLPPDQDQLVNPTNSSPSFIGVGVGVQNYTCTSSGAYT